MTFAEAEIYKSENEITSRAIWDEDLQKWSYNLIDEKMKISGDAQGLRVSREVMTELYKWFPDRNDEASNRPIYTARELNQRIRSAIAQNYKRIDNIGVGANVE